MNQICLIRCQLEVHKNNCTCVNLFRWVFEYEEMENDKVNVGSLKK